MAIWRGHSASCGIGTLDREATDAVLDAHPWAGLWRFVVDLPDGTKCNNDGVAPGTVTFKVDAPRQEDQP